MAGRGSAGAISAIALALLVACPANEHPPAVSPCAAGFRAVGSPAGDGRRLCAPTGGARRSPSIDYRAAGPIGPVNSLNPERICLGFAGGPPPPTPVNDCHPLAASVHLGPGVDVGGYVEIRLDSSHRVNWIEVYAGFPPG